MFRAAVTLATALLALCAPLSLRHAWGQQFNQRAAVSLGATGVVVTGVAGKQTYVYGLDLVTASSVTVQLSCGSTNVTGAMTVNGTYSKQVIVGPPYWVCPAGVDFKLTLGSSVQTSGAVWYSQQ